MHNYKNASDFIISQAVPTKNTVNQSQSFSMRILCHMGGLVSAWGQDTGIDRLTPNSSSEQRRSFLGIVVCDLPNKHLGGNMSILLTTVVPHLEITNLSRSPCFLHASCVLCPVVWSMPEWDQDSCAAHASLHASCALGQGIGPVYGMGPALIKELRIKPC